MNTPENLDIINQVTKAIQEQTASLNALTEALGRNASVSQSINDANKSNVEQQTQQKDALKGVTDAMREQQDGVSGLAAALGRNNGAMADADKEQRKQIDTLAKYAENIVGANIAITAMYDVMNNMKMGAGLFFDTFTAGFGMMQAGIGLLMSPFEGLMKMGAAYNNEMAGKMFSANQKVVDSFGDLQGPAGGFVKQMKKDLIPASKSLAKANNSLWAAIGDAPEILGVVTQLAGDMGDQFIRLQDQLSGAADEMFLMNRGMGISGESMKMLAINAEAMGGSLEESMQEGMIASAHLANQFGVDVKQIGKNMDKMMKNMSDFGHLSQKELAATAAYSAKLGVSIESLTKLMSGFDTFESAAQNAGKLAEAFGMNVDVMGMMNAENPAERMDMLRKSFEETGKSVNDLSRHELKLLSESMGGIPVEELKAGLSMSSDEMGFGDFSDAAEEAAEKLTPEQAMEKVAKSINKLNQQLTKLSGGPLTDFINGFKEGLMNSAEFKDIIADIGTWLRQFSNYGKEIGKMFAKYFLKPGTKMHTVMNNIFNIKRVTAFLDNVKAAFDGLFKGLAGLTKEKDPAKLAKTFLDNLLAAFTSWTEGTGNTGLVDGLKSMLETALRMVAGMAPTIIAKAAEYIGKFTTELKKFLEDPKGKAQEQVGEGLQGAFVLAFDAIKGAMPMLLDALEDLFWTLLQASAPYLLQGLKILWIASFVKTLFTAASAKGIIKAIAWFAKMVTGNLKKAQEKENEKTNKNITKGNQSLSESVSSMGDVIDKLAEVYDKGNIGKAAKALLILATAFAAALVIFTLAVVAIATLIGPVPWNDLAKAFVTIGVAVASMVALAKISDKLIDEKTMIQGGLGLFVGAAFIGISLLAYAKALQLTVGIIKTIKWEDFAKAALMIIPAILGTMALAAVGMGMIADGGFTLLVGGLGLVAGAIFLGVVGGVYGLAITETVKLMGKVDFKQGMEAFVLIGASLLAVVGLATVGGVVGLAIPLMLIAEKGVMVAADFLGVAMKAFAEGLVIGLKPFEQLDLKKAAKAFLLIQGALVALVEMVAVGTVFTAMDFFGGVSILKSSMSTAADFASSSFKKFATVLDELNKLDMGDPKVLQMKMDAVGKMIDAVARLADLGMKAGMMATVASLLGGGTPAEMMNSMGKFITDVVGSLQTIVESFVKMGKGLTEKEMKGMEAIANIIGVVAELAGALINPMLEMQKNVNFLSIINGDSASNQIKAMTGGITGILDAIVEKVGGENGLIAMLKAAVADVKNPDEFLKKSQALEAMFKGILAMIDSVTKLHAMTQKDIPWYKGGGTETDTSQITNLFKVANTVLGDTSLKTMLETTKKLVETIPSMSEEATKGFQNGIKATMQTIKSVVRLSKFFWDNAAATYLKGLADDFATMKQNQSLPSMVIADIVTEAAAIAEVMDNLGTADLGKIHLKPLVEGVLGYKGDQKFTVEAKGVNLGVKMSIVIDSEKLAESIVKGTVDKGGFFETTEEAAKGILEGDRQMKKWYDARG